jgi:hypothetical protein
LVGVAVKVTDVPSQTGFVSTEIVTLAVRMGFTVIVTVLEVAGFPEIQASLELITTEIASPSTGM